jgi:TfoX/Sxy family transcriptional regulator of competence genes
MGYDEGLAARVRELIEARQGVTERKMFGGIGWMIDGNMACGVMSTGGLIVRMAPEDTEAALAEPHVGEFGRPGSKPMRGFVVVEPDGVASDEALARWVDTGADHAASLPPK